MSVPHPFPYQGSKRKIAPTILKCFPRSEPDRLIEPFAGSGSVSILAVKKKKVPRVILNDLNKHLMDLWKKIVNEPHKLVKQYEKLWNKK